MMILRYGTRNRSKPRLFSNDSVLAESQLDQRLSRNRLLRGTAELFSPRRIRLQPRRRYDPVPDLSSRNPS